MKREHFTTLNVAMFLCPIFYAIFLLGLYNLEFWPRLLKNTNREVFVLWLFSSLMALVFGNIAAFYVMFSKSFADKTKTTAKFYAVGFFVFLLLIGFLGPD